jgi:hypothetical protein
MPMPNDGQIYRQKSGQNIIKVVEGATPGGKQLVTVDSHKK